MTPRYQPRKRPGTPTLVAVKGVPIRHELPPLFWWDKIANEYARAIHATTLGICCMTTTRAAVDHTDELSHWQSLVRQFMAPVADRYVNVVCCDNGEVHQFFTVGAAANVAITGTYPRPPNEAELRALRHYDAIWAISPKDAEELVALGLPAVHVPADATVLERMLKELLP